VRIAVRRRVAVIAGEAALAQVFESRVELDEIPRVVALAHQPTPEAGDDERPSRLATDLSAKRKGEIESLGIAILGLRFVLTLEPANLDKHPFLQGARYRPGRIEVSYPSSTNWITMSWDGKRERENLTVKFLRMVQQDKRRQQSAGDHER
jgi:hypothetical protein